MTAVHGSAGAEIRTPPTPQLKVALTGDARSVVNQRRHATQVRRCFEVLHLKFAIVEEERRKTVELEYDEFMDDLREAQALDWEVTWGADRAARIGREAGFRRNEGRKVLAASQDRDLRALAAQHDQEVQALRAASAADIAAVVQQQREDLAQLPEEAAQPIRQRIDKKVAILQAAATKKVMGLEASHNVSYDVAAAKWRDELDAYDVVTKSTYAVFQLMCEEELVRGNGVEWRAEWWAREYPKTAAAEAAPHLSAPTTDKAATVLTPTTAYRGPRVGVLYGGIHFEEFQGREVVYFICRSVATHAMTEDQLRDDFTGGALQIWKWMMIERHGIERKEFKDVERAARQDIHLQNHNERCEKIRILLTCDEMKYRFDQVYAAAAWWEDALEDFHATRVFLARWLGVRYYERKAVTSEEDIVRIEGEQTEDLDALQLDEGNGYWHICYAEWLDYRRVERLEVELEERAVFEEGVWQTRCDELNALHSEYTKKLYWLQKIELSQLALRMHHDIDEEAMRVVDLITLEDHGWGFIAETWEENLRVDRRKLASKELIARFPIEAEAELDFGEDGTLTWYHHWVTDIVHPYWQWKHAHERRTLEEVEAFLRDQLDFVASCDEMWFYYTEALLPIQVQFLEEKHAIERRALEDVETTLRWQCEEEAYGGRFYDIEVAQWVGWRLMMYQHLDEMHGIERRALERECMRCRFLDVEAAANEDEAEHLWPMWLRGEHILLGQQALAELQVIERAALADVEGVLRWQVETVEVGRMCIEMAWYDEWVHHVYAWWREFQVIERHALNEVETVMRGYCELTYEKTMTQHRFQCERGLMCVQFWMTVDEIERYAMNEVEFVFRWQLRLQEFDYYYDVEAPWWHEHVQICDAYWQEKHWLQRKMVLDAEAVERFYDECDYETTAITQEWWVSWGHAATEFLNAKHAVEQREIMNAEDTARLTGQALVEVEFIYEIEEPRAFSYIWARFREGIFLYKSWMLGKKEAYKRFLLEAYEDLVTTPFAEDKAYIEFKLAFMSGRHAIFQWYASEREALQRFQVADEPLERTDVQLLYWHELLQFSGEFRTEKHRIERHEFEEAEERKRQEVEEGLTRWQIAHEETNLLRGIHIAFAEQMWMVRWSVFLRIEAEERTRLEDVLLTKWTEFFDAVCSTIAFIRKAAANAASQRRKMVELEQHSLTMSESMERRALVEQEDRVATFVFDIFPKSLRFSLREQEGRLVMVEARERFVAETQIEMHYAATIDRFQRAIKQLQHAEDRETMRYRKWRYTSPTGLLKLVRAASESVKPETTAFKGLRRLHRCVLFNLRKIEKDENKKQQQDLQRQIQAAQGMGGYLGMPGHPVQQGALRHAPAYAHLGGGGYPGLSPGQVVVHQGVVRPLIRLGQVRMIEQDPVFALDAQVPQEGTRRRGGTVLPGVVMDPMAEDPLGGGGGGLVPRGGYSTLGNALTPGVRSARALSSMHDSPSTAAMYRDASPRGDAPLNLANVKMHVLHKKSMYFGEVGSALATLLVCFADAAGTALAVPAARVAFRLKNPDTAVLAAVNQNHTVFEVIVVPSEAGSYKIVLQAMFDGSDMTAASVKLKVSIEVDRPEGVSDGAWKLFKLLQQRIGKAESEADLDEHARFMLSTIRENKHFAQLHVQLGDRYPWLAAPVRGGARRDLAPLTYIPVASPQKPRQGKAAPARGNIGDAKVSPARKQLPPLKNSPSPEQQQQQQQQTPPGAFSAFDARSDASGGSSPPPLPPPVIRLESA